MLIGKFGLIIIGNDKFYTYNNLERSPIFGKTFVKSDVPVVCCKSFEQLPFKFLTDFKFVYFCLWLSNPLPVPKCLNPVLVFAGTEHRYARDHLSCLEIYHFDLFIAVLLFDLAFLLQQIITHQMKRLQQYIYPYVFHQTFVISVFPYLKDPQPKYEDLCAKLVSILSVSVRQLPTIKFS